MMAVVFERNRLGRGGGWEGEGLARRIAEDHQLGGRYSLRGVNLVVWIKRSWWR